jgi:predicted acetyltransferase
MTEIRILATDDFDAAARIFGDAYPGIKIVSEEDRQRFKQRALKLHQEAPEAHFHGLFRDGQLLGIMCLYDFSMNFLQARIPAGGVGQVAVALSHKKEHVAKEMMLYFLRHYRQRGVPLVALYPFRPDFYRQMGFGYGTKMDQYRVKPSALPRDLSKANVRYLTEEDKQAVADCYHRFADRTHGMMLKTEREVNRLFKNPQHRIVGYENDGEIQGYLVFTWEHGDNFITNDIRVQEFIYETREALSQLLTFLNTQADQIRHIYITTQDEDFHHLLLDPRNDSDRLIPDVYHETNTQGLGLMYRVVDVPGVFDRLGERDPGTAGFVAQTYDVSMAIETLKLTVADSFLPENDGSTLLRFERGRAQRLERGNADVQVSMAIEDFSSLLAGIVTFRNLYRYGLADISNEAHVQTVTRLFAVEQKPMCTTSF